MPLNSRLQRAREARKKAQNNLALLAQDLNDVNKQVAPMAKLVEDAQANARTSRLLS